MNTDLEIKSTDIRPDLVLLELRGEISISRTGDLREFLRNLADQEKNVIVNMAGVTYLNSAGLGALLAGRANLSKIGRQLSITNLTISAYKVLELNNLTTVFDVHDDVEHALAKYK